VGAEVSIRAFDRTYKSFDLRRNGDIHPSILYNFGVHYLGLDEEQLSDYASSHQEIQTSPFIVKGTPSSGFEGVEATQENLETLNKSVLLVGDTYRLIVREAHE
jgi:hypothetical protein